MQHLYEDLHLTGGQRQEVLVLFQVDLLLVRGAQLTSPNRTIVGQAKELDDIAQLRRIGLQQPVADIAIDALQLESVQLDDHTCLKWRNTEDQEDGNLLSPVLLE